MIKEAIEKVLSLAGPTLFDEEGRRHVAIGGRIEAIRPPRVEPIVFASLTGLVEFILDADFGDPRTAGSFVHVVDHKEVVWLGSLHRAWQHREAFGIARFVAAREFPWEKQLPQSEFITLVRQAFVWNEHVAAIVAVVGNVEGQSTVRLLDDGVTQEVTARAGVARLANIALPPVVHLAPYRSFPEAAQVESPAFLRAWRDKNEQVLFSLHRVDDPTWQVEARARVKAWMCRELDVTAEGETCLAVIG